MKQQANGDPEFAEQRQRAIEALSKRLSGLSADRNLVIVAGSHPATIQEIAHQECRPCQPEDSDEPNAAKSIGPIPETFGGEALTTVFIVDESKAVSQSVQKYEIRSLDDLKTLSENLSSDAHRQLLRRLQTEFRLTPQRADQLSPLIDFLTSESDRTAMSNQQSVMVPRDE